jgi:hypothetical protein
MPFSGFWHPVASKPAKFMLSEVIAFYSILRTGTRTASCMGDSGPKEIQHGGCRSMFAIRRADLRKGRRVLWQAVEQ